MTPKSSRAVVILGGVIGFLDPVTAQSHETETEVRIQAAARGELFARAELTASVEERLRENDRDRVLTTTIDFVLADFSLAGSSIELSAAAQVQDISGRTELRPFQQVILTAGDFSFRTRLEERFLENADQMALRLRNRAQFSRQIALARAPASPPKCFFNYVIACREAQGGSTNGALWPLRNFRSCRGLTSPQRTCSK